MQMEITSDYSVISSSVSLAYRCRLLTVNDNTGLLSAHNFLAEQKHYFLSAV